MKKKVEELEKRIEILEAKEMVRGELKPMIRILMILYTYFRAIETLAGRIKWKIHEKMWERIYE